MHIATAWSWRWWRSQIWDDLRILIESVAIVVDRKTKLRVDIGALWFMTCGHTPECHKTRRYRHYLGVNVFQMRLIISKTEISCVRKNRAIDRSPQDLSKGTVFVFNGYCRSPRDNCVWQKFSPRWFRYVWVLWHTVVRWQYVVCADVAVARLLVIEVAALRLMFKRGHDNDGKLVVDQQQHKQRRWWRIKRKSKHSWPRIV